MHPEKVPATTAGLFLHPGRVYSSRAGLFLHPRKITARREGFMHPEEVPAPREGLFLHPGQVSAPAPRRVKLNLGGCTSFLFQPARFLHATPLTSDWHRRGWFRPWAARCI